MRKKDILKYIEEEIKALYRLKERDIKNSGYTDKDFMNQYPNILKKLTIKECCILWAINKNAEINALYDIKRLF